MNLADSGAQEFNEIGKSPLMGYSACSFQTIKYMFFYSQPKA